MKFIEENKGTIVGLLILAVLFSAMTAGLGDDVLPFWRWVMICAAVLIGGGLAFVGLRMFFAWMGGSVLPWIGRAHSEVVALVVWIVSVVVTTVAGTMNFLALAEITVAIIAVWFGWVVFLNVRAAREQARILERLMPRPDTRR